MKHRLLIAAFGAWYRLGMWWTERACQRHGGDHYSEGYPWLLRVFGWDS
jgi:hypothetical protein